MVQLHGILRRNQHAQVAKIFRELIVFDQSGGFLVVQVLVIGVHFRGFAARRAVLIDRHIRDLLFAHRLGDVEEQHLRAAHGKGRDDDAMTFLGRILQNPEKALDRFLAGRVILVTVSRFQENEVGPAGKDQIAQDRRAARTDVAGENDRPAAARLRDRQLQARGAQDVARFEEPGHHARRDLVLLLVGQPLKLVRQPGNFLLAVERLHLRYAGAPGDAGSTLGVGLLNVRGVFQDDFRQVDRRRGCEHGTAVAAFRKQR